MPVTDQQSLARITCSFNWSAVPINDYLSLPLISSRLHVSAVPVNDSSLYQWLLVPSTYQQSVTMISSPYYWSEVPNNDYLFLPLISSHTWLPMITCPYGWLAVPSTDQQSLIRLIEAWFDWKTCLCTFPGQTYDIWLVSVPGERGIWRVRPLRGGGESE